MNTSASTVRPGLQVNTTGQEVGLQAYAAHIARDPHR